MPPPRGFSTAFAVQVITGHKNHTPKGAGRNHRKIMQILGEKKSHAHSAAFPYSANSSANPLKDFSAIDWKAKRTTMDYYSPNDRRKAIALGPFVSLGPSDFVVMTSEVTEKNEEKCQEK